MRHAEVSSYKLKYTNIYLCDGGVWVADIYLLALKIESAAVGSDSDMNIISILASSNITRYICMKHNVEYRTAYSIYHIRYINIKITERNQR